MSATVFDTHKVAKTLTKAGFTEPQVEAQVEVLTEFSGDLVTKEHFELRLKLLKKDLVNTLTVRMCLVGGFIIGMVKYLP
tara:strand:- start:267 stop:506 length:240 start_codon:yes stop_codon:yes gene_type:complete